MYILAVDDDKSMLDVYKQGLNHFNVFVRCAVDGIEAIKMYRESKDSIDLVVMDYEMPRLNGLEAAKAIKKINRDAKILLVTGATIDKPVEFIDMMRKPILLSSFIQKVLDCCKR